MRLAILGSVVTQIPPAGQAAIETLVYYQAHGLAQKGHKILLFAPQGSTISHPNIELVEVGRGGTLSGRGSETSDMDGEQKFGSSYKLRLELANLGFLLKELLDRKDQYDIVLNNLRGEAVVVPILAQLKKPLFHIMHLPLFPQLVELFNLYQTKLISISNAQRRAFPQANYTATVYNGVDTNLFAFNPTPQDYFLYLGSISPNKNPAAAVRACLAAGVTLKIGGRIKDTAYYEKEIKPFIDGVKVIWIGETTQSEIIRLYQNARAFLFPTLWEEPFGLVMIEAMSCGTPVIAYNNGAIPEVVTDGETGYVIENNSEEVLVEKIKDIEKIERKECRQHVIENFSIEKMVSNYENILLNAGPAARHPANLPG